MRSPRSAFSLMELLVVSGILGVLLGVILPAVQQTRESAARISCLNNLKQIGVGLQNFHDHHGRFPPLPVSASQRRSDPNARLGWMALILPQMGEEPVYKVSIDACRTDTNPLHNPPHIGLASVVWTYVCPRDGRLLAPLTDRFGVRSAFTSYIAILGTLPGGAIRGLDGMLGDMRGRRVSDARDGSSQTIIVGERTPPDSLQAGWWYPVYYAYAQGFRGPNNAMILGGHSPVKGDPCVVLKGTFGPGRTDNPCDRFHLWSFHPGGANFLFADGSVRYFPYSAEPIILALATRAGGEVVALPD